MPQDVFRVAAKSWSIIIFFVNLWSAFYDEVGSSWQLKYTLARDVYCIWFFRSLRRLWNRNLYVKFVTRMTSNVFHNFYNILVARLWKAQVIACHLSYIIDASFHAFQLCMTCCAFSIIAGTVATSSATSVPPSRCLCHLPPNRFAFAMHAAVQFRAAFRHSDNFNELHVWFPLRHSAVLLVL